MRFLDPPARQYSPRVVQVVALIGVAASSFTITVLSAALPTIADDLDSSTGTVTWVIAGPLLAFAVFTPMAGKLGDLYGHRRMYLLGFTGAAVMSLVTAASPNAAFLIGARILAQAFSSSTGPSALALMMQAFPDDRRTSVAGVWSAVLAASPALGVVVGGPLIDATSWRTLFVIQSVGMAVAVIAASRVLPDSERRDDLTFDLWGGLFLAAGIATILIPLNRASSLGWDHPVVAGGLALSPVFLIGFVVWERRTAHPLIELAVLRERNVALPLVSQLFLNGPYMAGLVITSLMLGATSTFAYSTTAISLLILPRPIMFAIGAWVAGWLTERFGGRPVVMLGCTGISAGLLAIGIGAVTGEIGFVVAGVATAGAGSGIARPPIIAALTDAVGDRDLGVGTGMLNMAGQIGAAAGISLLSALVTDTSTPERFRFVFVIGAAVSTLAIGIAGAIRFSETLPAARTTPSPTAPYSATVDVRK
ncbi:MAG: MFS transporter [Acidimicrobiales bacterium]|nr:MFS transporter [Acidimicrobiales bacterium]